MAKQSGRRDVVDQPANNVAISVKNVSKSFKLPHNRQNSIKGSLVNLLGGGDRTYETQQVLRNVSFGVKKGDFFGIVGRNGSGKSTLLKMLAGIYKPTEGVITVNGSLTPFIELGVGFNHELTGRENVFLNGALLGFNNKEVAEMYDEIVEFAELERFMDQKLKNYSSGMQVRLAFSIAIRARSDILILDEVLAVGDELFQRKCFDYFDTLKRNNKTVVLVTHDMDAVQRYCTKAILIQDGEIVLEGDPQSAAKKYTEINMQGYEMPSMEVDETGRCKIELLGGGGKSNNKFASGDTASIKISWDDNDIDCVGVAVCKQSGECVFSTSTMHAGLSIKKKSVTYNLSLDIAEGNYFFQVGLYSGGGKKQEDFEQNGPAFMVGASDTWTGIAALKYAWKQ
jgi:ABC-type polysaccharide/polyol phosphate transport system ATPase subunit